MRFCCGNTTVRLYLRTWYQVPPYSTSVLLRHRHLRAGSSHQQSSLARAPQIVSSDHTFYFEDSFLLSNLVLICAEKMPKRKRGEEATTRSAANRTGGGGGVTIGGGGGGIPNRDARAASGAPSLAPTARKGNYEVECPYLDTIDRAVLDFDFQKVCSVTLSTQNVYVCLVCGKFFKGKAPKTPAFTHSVQW